MRSKHVLFILVATIMATTHLSAQFQPQYYNNGKLCVARDEYVKILDNNQKTVKTISLKPETTKIDSRNVVLVTNPPNVSGNGKFFTIEKYGWEVNAYDYIGEIYSYINYYNDKGKMLWKKYGYSGYINHNGEKVIYCEPHYSEGAKRYEYDLLPEMSDPKHRESIVLVSSDGKELCRFTARIIEMYRFITDDVFSFAYTDTNKLTDKAEISALFNIHNKTILSSSQDSTGIYSKYRYDGSNGNIYMRLPDGSSRIIKPEEWK